LSTGRATGNGSDRARIRGEVRVRVNGLHRVAAAAAVAAGLAASAPPAAAEGVAARLLFLGADPVRGAPGPSSGALPMLAMPVLPAAAAARAEVTAALLRSNPVSTFVASPDALGGTVQDFFLVADLAVAADGSGVALGGEALQLPEFGTRLAAVVDALAPERRQIAFLRLADPGDAFPMMVAEVQSAVGAAGFAMTVLTVDGGDGGGACEPRPGGAGHFAVVAGVADRAPFGDGDGRSSVAEVEAWLAAALAREARRGGACAARYSLIVKAEADPARVLALHGPAPLFPEMESRLYLESFEAMFLLRSDDQGRVRGFLESCSYCPHEAALVERLREMRERELALALETQIWDEIRADVTPDRLEIYLGNCTLCAFREPAEARLAELRAAAEAAAAEAAALDGALAARDLAALRAWTEGCARCEGRARAEHAIAEIEADAAYRAERAALAEAVAAGEPATLRAWLEGCRICDGRAEAEAALARAARLAELTAPCLGLAGLPQQGGPRRLEDIDRDAAAAACGAARSVFPADATLLTLAGRIDQAAGRTAEAAAAYAAGVSAGVPFAHGLAAYLHFAPAEGTEPDLARAEELALAGAALGDWLSREILIVLYSRDLVAGRTAADAFAIARDLAAEDNPVAQFFAGYFYLTGTGVEPSDGDAARWLAAAAGQGYTHAYAFLAEMVEAGRGLPAEPERAAELYWAALNAGDITARDRLTGQLSERSREVIRLIQDRLREAGVYAGRVDGLPGPGTVAAVERYVDSLASAG
jgi:TPR repeat protein